MGGREKRMMRHKKHTLAPLIPNLDRNIYITPYHGSFWGTEGAIALSNETLVVVSMYLSDNRQ